MSRKRRARARRRESERKDRLIQTRVAEDLEQTLKREAARRRLTVSHLIRNTLEDAFELVEGVSKDVEHLVSGSVELAATVKRDAQRIASIVRGVAPSNDQPLHASDADDRRTTRGTETKPETAAHAPDADDRRTASASEAKHNSATQAPDADDADALAHIYGWNRVIANLPATCVKCRAGIERGDDACVGLSDQPTKPRAWLCPACAEKL
jgi:hypothetical protein